MSLDIQLSSCSEDDSNASIASSFLLRELNDLNLSISNTSSIVQSPPPETHEFRNQFFLKIPKRPEKVNRPMFTIIENELKSPIEETPLKENKHETSQYNQEINLETQEKNPEAFNETNPVQSSILLKSDYELTRKTQESYVICKDSAEVLKEFCSEGFQVDEYYCSDIILEKAPCIEYENLIVINGAILQKDLIDLLKKLLCFTIFKMIVFPLFFIFDIFGCIALKKIIYFWIIIYYVFIYIFIAIRAIISLSLLTTLNSSFAYSIAVWALLGVPLEIIQVFLIFKLLPKIKILDHQSLSAASSIFFNFSKLSKIQSQIILK